METTALDPSQTLNLLPLYLAFVGLPAAVFATLGAYFGSKRCWFGNGRASLIAGAGLTTLTGLFVLGILWLVWSSPTSEYWLVGLIVLAHLAGWSAAGASIGSFLGSLRSTSVGVACSPIGAVILGLTPLWFVL